MVVVVVMAVLGASVVAVDVVLRVTVDDVDNLLHISSSSSSPPSQSAYSSGAVVVPTIKPGPVVVS